MDLIITLFVVAGTAFLMFRRASRDLRGNRGYLYLLGALLALSLGMLLTGSYDRPLVQWLLPLFFFLVVLLPQILIQLRNLQLQSGEFDRAAFLQDVITVLVWSRNERDVREIAEAGRRIRSGEVDQANDILEELEGRAGREPSVTEMLMQLRVLVSGQRRHWRAVVREFERFRDPDEGDLWTPTLIYVAQGCVETGKFRTAERILNVLENRTLNTQQELAIRTVRVGYLMLQGEYEAGTLMIHQVVNEYDDVLPEPYSDYWKARGCMEAGRFDEARDYFERALEKARAEQNTEWKTVIEERMEELEIERNRRRHQSTYRLEGDELHEPVEDWTEESSETVVEAEPAGETSTETAPPPEVLQFIERVNRMPWATSTILGIIGVLFLAVWLTGVQKEYPEGSGITNSTYDPVVLTVFGMKADFMINESHHSSSGNVRKRINQVSDVLSTDIARVNRLSNVKKKLNEANVPANDRGVRELWMEARYAELFGFNSRGNIDFPKHQYWRLATCTLLHIGLIHLLLNGYALWILGKLLENIYGISDFLIIYLSSGLTGSVASWQFGASPSSAGASGAIFGLLGAAIALTIIKKEGLPEQIRQRLARPLLFWTGVNLALGFWMTNIDNAGHIGGLVGGLLFGYLLSAGNEQANGDGVDAVRLCKWGFLALLVAGYSWSIFKGISFALTYVDQIT